MFALPKNLIFYALFAAFIALPGCVSSDRARAARAANPAPCPNVVVLSDAARLIDFAGDEQSLADIAYTGEFRDVSLVCRYFADEPIEAEVFLTMDFGRGPQGREAAREFTYFVAVTRIDREVIEKKEFTVPVDFNKRRAIKSIRQEIDKIIIPRANKDTAGQNFEVVVGFKLTPAQARFNRSGQSLKFPDL